MSYTVKIIPNDKGNPVGKLCDAEIHFAADPNALRDVNLVSDLLRKMYAGGDGRRAAPGSDLDAPMLQAVAILSALRDAAQAGDLFDGLKLIGFSVWERRTRDGRNVTFPARQYSVNGERRSFALLRPIEDTHAQERIKQAILDAYEAYEQQAAQTV